MRAPHPQRLLLDSDKQLPSVQVASLCRSLAAPFMSLLLLPCRQCPPCAVLCCEPVKGREGKERAAGLAHLWSQVQSGWSDLTRCLVQAHQPGAKRRGCRAEWLSSRGYTAQQQYPPSFLRAQHPLAAHALPAALQHEHPTPPVHRPHFHPVRRLALATEFLLNRPYDF